MEKVQQLINDFYLLLKKSGKKGRTPDTYRKKVEIFFEYLITNKKINDENYKDCLKGLEKGEFLESITYYVQQGNIKYKATVDGYFAALTVFFGFIQNEYGLDNVRFSQNTENRLLKEAYAKRIKELNLKSKETTQPIDDEQYVTLVKLCDEKIDKVTDEDLIKKGYNSQYSYYISALATKLVLFSGIKNNVIFNLKLGCYDEELNKICINGFSIHLPADFAMQMKRFKNIRQRILEKEEEDGEDSLLFINLNKDNRKLDNAKMFKILKDVIGTNKAVAVAKYSILKMIEYGIPENIIRKFTGYSDDVYGHCQEMTDELRVGNSLNEKNRVLESGLLRIGIFDEDRMAENYFD
ncbi:MAG: hypothetical protein PHG16_12540 [Lachnospiraceae bacterium]|nr:hypothetical protein [Lachnospiraceae bacterium]